MSSRCSIEASPSPPGTARRRRVGGCRRDCAPGIGLDLAGARPPPPKFPGASWTKALGPTHLSSPVIADVNGDGHLDVVTADLSGMLHVLDGRTGRDLPGWPQPVQPSSGRRSRSSRARPSPTSTTTAARRSSSARAPSTSPASKAVSSRSTRTARVRWRIQTDDGRRPERCRRHARGRRRERRRLPRRRVRQLRPPHLRGRPLRSARSPASRSTASTRSGTRPRCTTRRTSVGWTSSSAATRARAVRAGLETWSGILRAIRVTSSGPQHPVVALPASDLPVEPRDRRHRAATAGWTWWSVPGPGRRATPVATNSLNAFHLDNGSPVAGWPVLLNGPIFGSPVIGDVNGDQQERRRGHRVRDLQRRPRVGVQRPRQPLWDVVPARRRTTTPRSSRRRSSSISTATA